MEESRLSGVAHGGYRLLGETINFFGIGGVARGHMAAEAGDDLGDRIVALAEGRRSMYGPAVILADEEHRQPHDAGGVQALPKHTLIHGPFAEKDGDNLSVRVSRIGERRAHGHGDRRPDHG